MNAKMKLFSLLTEYNSDRDDVSACHDAYSAVLHIHRNDFQISEYDVLYYVLALDVLQHC